MTTSHPTERRAQVFETCRIAGTICATCERTAIVLYVGHYACPNSECPTYDATKIPKWYRPGRELR